MTATTRLTQSNPTTHRPPDHSTDQPNIKSTGKPLENTVNSTVTSTEVTSNSTVTQHVHTVNSTTKSPEITSAAYELNSTATHWESNSTATPWESISTATPWESNSTATPWESKSTATHWESTSTTTRWEANATSTPTANATFTPRHVVTHGTAIPKGTNHDQHHNHFPHDGWHFAVIGSGATLGLILIILLIVFRKKLFNRARHNQMRKRSHSEIQTSQRKKHKGSKVYNDLVGMGFKNDKVSDNIDDILAEETEDRVRIQRFKMNRKPSWGFSRKGRKVSAGESKEQDNQQTVKETFDQGSSGDVESVIEDSTNSS
ncbi:probable transcription-associated protein 1 [Lineus longissimus]|uniref:probable transcription-associated protein 1 n=1 Tax=Lineus longissimus TaxID=88925 RepID=UPI00315DC33E